MNIVHRQDSLVRLSWSGGELRFNLVPMNSAAARDNGIYVGYASVRPEAVLANSIADLVGIVGLDLAGRPRNPRICWDNREHQFWDGFEGAFEPRNTVVNAPRAELTEAGAKVEFYYIANLVKTSVAWQIREPAGPDTPLIWDTHITVENLGPRVLRNYLLLFACYHEPGMNAYWGADGAITPCAAGGFMATRDAAQEERLRASPSQIHSDRYLADQDITICRYAQPILLSPPRPWFGGARHVLMVEPLTCAAIVSWLNQARDYLLRPPNHDLAPGAGFTARVRHTIAPARNETDLERLWTAFQTDLAAGR